MGNVELENLLGRIFQLVKYHELDESDLIKIKDFCDRMIDRLGFIDEPETFDFSDFTVKRQEDITAAYTIKVMDSKTCPDNSMSGTGVVDSLDVLNWRNEYTDLLGKELKYFPSVEITKEVAQDLFKNSTTMGIKVYLGEVDNYGLVFLTVDEAKNEYYIISNTSKKKPLTKSQCDGIRDKYNSGLKSLLDTYIVDQTGDPKANNTRRFILGRKMYENFIRASSTITANSVITFYPVIYLDDDYLQYKNDKEECVKVQHKYRLTFLMTSEYYVMGRRTPIEKQSVYDRNGLCPPPDDAIC